VEFYLISVASHHFSWNMDRHQPAAHKATGTQASSRLVIHEILDDEAGYEADIEILRPDAYEEPDSEKSEDEADSSESEEQWRNELVKQMNSLSCDPNARLVSVEDDSRRGRKRRSKDAFGAPVAQISTVSSENQIEITEIADDHETRPRLKRLRRRSRRSKTVDKPIREVLGSESERGQNGKDKKDKGTFQEESVTTELSSPERPDDAMDLG
jgi:Insulin-resistance promoting peptide in skeletal muscle